MQYFIKSHTLMHNSAKPAATSVLHHFNDVFYEKLAVEFYSYEKFAYWIFYLPVNNSGKGERLRNISLSSSVVSTHFMTIVYVN